MPTLRPRRLHLIATALVTVALVGLAGCSSKDSHMQLTPCGPSGACPMGFSCDSSSQLCMQTGTSNVPDAAVRPPIDAPGADIDAPGTGIDAPGTGIDAPPKGPPDAGVPDAPVACTPGQPLPPPSLATVCSGPDEYEPNNTADLAAPLGLACAQARIGAGITGNDDDWYRFTTPTSDPVTLTVTYTVGSNDNTTQLILDLEDATQSLLTLDDTPRTMSTQVLEVSFESTPSASYFATVESNSSTCTAYDLDINTAVCTDPYEDNDDIGHPYVLTLTPSTEVTDLTPTIDGYDDDYFQITAPTADPVHVTVTYTRPASDNATMRLYVYDAAGNFITSDETPRPGLTQTLDTFWQASAAGAVYNLGIDSSVPNDCFSYALHVDGAACTDSAEDNDSFDTPSDLSAGTHTYTITDLDADYYRIVEPATSGSCTVSYTVTSTNAQDISIYLYTVDQALIDFDETPRSGLSETPTVTWIAGDNPYILEVDGSADECTSYTLICQ